MLQTFFIRSESLLIIDEVANILAEEMIVAIVFVGCPLIEPIAICGGPF